MRSKMFIMLMLAPAALVLMAGAAYAAEGDLVVPTEGNVITFPLVLVTALSGLIIPIVHGIITKEGGNQSVKVIVGLFLSAVAGVINSAVVLDGVAVISWATVGTAAMAWITQVAIYKNLYRPIGNPQKVLPNSGLG